MTKKATKLVKKTTRKKPRFNPDTATTDQAYKHYKNDLEFAQWVFNKFFQKYASLGNEGDKSDMRYLLKDFGYSVEYFFDEEGI